ncbi:HAD family phosphatase [Maribrevibacterium harenarium]|uniref:HAD family phosphatase n=1 Tax=Maribrevibacterium harenarium TaxID=2589817 RepID=A0A501WAY4_9GAMM|nr:HAD-IIB family hydrolase [Maribrevibacterium harenarium]TPE47093.1 HAD family phosphatase [Maribrevibacterium harenarium]
MSPALLSDVTREQLSQVRYVLTDVDDTLTWQGKLPAQTLTALYDLQQAGIKVIPVTGGCAGWSDMIASAFPVAGVISEGGGVFLEVQGKRINYHFFQSEEMMRTEQARILELVNTHLQKFPELCLARDQNYRLTDVAVDYAQRIVPPALEQKDALLALLKQQGLNAKASSIHINICADGVDKFAMTHKVLTQHFGLNATDFPSQVLYVGDAPNDESMFAQFPLSVGVANIAHHLPHMSYQPAFISQAPGGLGFAELASLIISSRTD